MSVTIAVLKGFTHAVLFFKAKPDDTGVLGMMKLCFGSDEDAIAQILYRRENRTASPVWVLPTRQAGADLSFPVLTGHMGEEALGIAGSAADRLKQAMSAGQISGKPNGRAFRVYRNGKIEEIKQQTTTSTT